MSDESCPQIFSHRLFGMGLTIEGAFQLDQGVIIRPSKLETDILKLVPLALTQVDYGFLCALSNAITFEIEVEKETQKEAAIVAWNSRWLLILLSIIGGKPIYAPFESYDRGDSIPKDKISTRFLYGIQRMFSSSRFYSENELKQCQELSKNFFSLLKEDRFSHASSIAANNFIEPRASIRMAAIWSGIEALFGFDQELKFRISLGVARLLESEPSKRQDRFSFIKRLYDLRSKSVHGATIDRDKEKEGVIDSLSLLRELLLFFARRGTMLDNIDRDKLFTE